ncbi:hypothetical protein LPJ66_005567 [Kickxella alabastrina]|uniref:Uncharacterized protein n=1 Tax=Kickxella alabastrina TaxID=61397 RepID=A0ACC1IMA7_9FUNG|nr:hypothetical protein LPJ66_005567 [Kickxella alabastrina]
MAIHRKKPFSVKQKKTQIQAKRAKKRDQADDDNDWDSAAYKKDQLDIDKQIASLSLGSSSANTSTAATDEKRNRLTSQFDKLTRTEIENNKRRSMLPLKRLSGEDGLTMSFEDAYSADVDIPVRPEWRYGETRATLERREIEYYTHWLEKIQQMKEADEVSLYEKNLEVWRQLWRVVEISDILLMVVDVRHPVLHFPPSLYRYITKTTGKPLVVVLNKTDLVADNTVRAWKKYFKEQFPSIILTSFCCYREKVMVNDTEFADLKLSKKKPGKRVYDSSQVGELFDACRSVCDAQKQSMVDWDALIARYTSKNKSDQDEVEVDEDSDADDDNDDNDNDNNNGNDIGSAAGQSATGSGEQGNADDQSEEQTAEGHVEAVSGRYVTLGLVGHPNVGKSTVINSIMGRTVVSTSRTPGHTKHFQTIHVTPTLRLCDCPGLVFPCVVERPMQVLAGLYNIAQIQEPYTSVQYLAERVPVEQLLNLLPENTSGMVKGQWSAWAICEAFAVDRGFYTSKAARPDVYRAALHILRWELDGRILMSFKPPGFFRDLSNENSRLAAEDAHSTGKNTRETWTKPKDTHNDASSSSEEEDDDYNSGPIAQQSAFAVLAEEDC